MSIVAATHGQTSVTGTTSETNLASLRIPAGSMGRNGHIEVKCLWSFTNSSNNKIFSIRFSQAPGAVTGQPGSQSVATTSPTAQTLWVIRNSNATNVQSAYANAGGVLLAPFGSVNATPVSGTVDTTQDAFINVNGILALSTETLTLVHAYAVVYPSNDASPPDLDISFMTSGTLDSRLTFSRASAATYTDATGTILPAAVNAPRWDYDPVQHTLRGLLLEDARTNIAFPSGNFAAWVTNLPGTVVTANSGIAPDGTTTMTRWSEQATNAAHYAQQSPLGITASQTYTFSLYAQAQENQWIQMFFDDGSNGVWAAFDLVAGTYQGPFVRGTGTATAASITPAGNNTFRCSITGVASTAVSVRAGIIFAPVYNAGFAQAYQGNTSNGCLLWGVQFEQGTFPSSYVPTTSAAVARSADLCTLASGSWRNATAETFKAELMYFDTGNQSARVLGNAAGAQAPIYLSPYSAGRQGGVYDGAALVATANRVAPFSLDKVATTWQSAPNAQVCLNAGTVAAYNQLITGFGAVSTFKFMGDNNPGDACFGWIRRFSYWNRVLSPAELQAVTT